MEYWKIPQMWTGDCWIIGGGPSLIHQFRIPSDVVAAVKNGEVPFSAYSPYLTPLHNRNVIGANAAFMLGEWVSVLYFCDRNFFRVNKEAILAFRNLKVTCSSSFDKTLLPLTTNIKVLKRDYEPGLSSKPDTICWNRNSGAAAINFAVLAGAERIFLLGFDMQAQEGKTHWHNHYKSKTQRPAFKKHLQGFPHIAADAKKKGIEIINVSPESAIECFPKKSLDQVL